MIDSYLVAGSLGIVGSVLLAVLGKFFIGVSPNLTAGCVALFVLGVVGIIYHEAFQNPMYQATNIKDYTR